MKTIKELCKSLGISNGSARYWILKLGIKGKTRIVGGRAVKFYRKTDIAKLRKAVMGPASMPGDKIVCVPSRRGLFGS